MTDKILLVGSKNGVDTNISFSASDLVALLTEIRIDTNSSGHIIGSYLPNSSIILNNIQNSKLHLMLRRRNYSY